MSGSGDVQLRKRIYQGECCDRQWSATLGSDGRLTLKGNFLSYDGTLSATLHRVQ